jgi:Tol biopolymer transport system component
MSVYQKHGIISYFKALLIASIVGFPVIALIGCTSPTKPDQDMVMESIDYSRFEGRIAFSRTYPINPESVILDPYLVVVDATRKTSKLTRLHGHPSVWERSVALSPVSDLLTFSANTDSAAYSFNLYTLDSNVAIFKFAVNGAYPVFTHDGQWVLYHLNRISDGATCVYRIKPDGMVNTQLFIYGTTRYINGRISPSPDGSQITFSVGASICIANIDGTSYREIVKAGDHESLYETAWSPDSNRIAFVSRRGPNEGNQPPYVYTILSVDSTGNSLDTICTMQQANYYCDVYIAWSPDGSHIAYNQMAAGDQGAHIFVVDASGGEPVKITSGDSWDSGPCWVR